jgi:hypothetical protein
MVLASRWAFCVDIRTDSDFCFVQHKLIGFYNRGGKFLLRGTNWVFNPLKAELNPICHLLALVGAHHILHVSVFYIYLRTNSYLCHLYHKLIGFYNRDEKFLLRGTNWVFK